MNTANRKHSISKPSEYTYCFTTLPEDEGISLLQFLKNEGFSHHLLVRMKECPALVTVNGSVIRFREALHAGDVISVTLPPEESSDSIVPAEIHPDIVYEDEELIIVNKPADMPIHPSIGNYDNTAANALAWYYESRQRPFVFRCINRLDRDTSGLWIAAKNAYSGALLSEQMVNRQIHRTYLSIVSGILPVEGTVNAPIARRDASVIERVVDEERGEKAVTHFRRIAVSDDGRFSLAEISLETGRTHQIRVHMKHIGHPLPGDFLYNPDYSRYKRQMLHSYRLTFTHPITGELMDITCDPPEDFHF